MDFFKVTALCVAALTATLASARADTITSGGTFDFSFEGGVGDFPSKLQVGTFNSALGALTGITLNFTGSVATTLYTSSTIVPVGYYTVLGYVGVEDGQLLLTGLPSQTIYVPQGSAIDYLNTPDVHQDLNITDLQNFETGGHPTIYGAATYALNPLDYNVDLLNYYSDYSGTYEEKFTYTPVPEPISVGLLMTGVFVMFGARVWRRKAIAQAT